MRATASEVRFSRLHSANILVQAVGCTWGCSKLPWIQHPNESQARAAGNVTETEHAQEAIVAKMIE